MGDLLCILSSTRKSMKHNDLSKSDATAVIMHLSKSRDQENKKRVNKSSGGNLLLYTSTSDKANPKMFSCLSCSDAN